VEVKEDAVTSAAADQGRQADEAQVKQEAVTAAGAGEAQAPGNSGPKKKKKLLANSVPGGVPAAVGEQVLRVGLKWGADLVFRHKFPEAPGQQEEVLGDLLAVLQLLVEGVVLPVGCNNPLCSNLGGLSEAAAASKRCSRCKTANYCNAGCQEVHYNQHKQTCKQLAALLAHKASKRSG
jgi:hypothetical protein